MTTRELAVKYTDEKRYFISESSAYRILKAADLITAPEYVVIKAADEFTGLCCTNPVRDSSRESSVVAVMHEQTHTPNLQDQELASLQ